MTADPQMQYQQHRRSSGAIRNSRYSTRGIEGYSPIRAESCLCVARWETKDERAGKPGSVVEWPFI